MTPKADVSLYPHNLDAEQGVLGTCLINPHLAPTLDLRPSDFYLPDHQRIWRAIAGLVAEDAAIDVLTVTERLTALGGIEGGNAESYLVGLMANVPSLLHADQYAEIVKDRAAQRVALESARTLERHIASTTESRASLLARVQAEAERLEVELRRNDAGRTGWQSLDRLVPGVVEQIETLRANPEVRSLGLETGITDLDRLTSGFRPGDLVVLAARPGMGKTALALSIAHHVAVTGGQTVAFFSLEMSAESLALRLISIDARVPFTRLQRGAVPLDQWERMRQRLPVLESMRLLIDEQGALELGEMTRRFTSLARALTTRSERVSLLIVDYLQLIPVRGAESKRLAVTAAVERLKALAKEHRVPVLLLSQLSRSVDDPRRANHRPMLSDLLESGGIEAAADLVVFLYRPSVHDADAPATVAELLIAKHRNGETGTVLTYWDAPTMHVRNLAHVSSEQVREAAMAAGVDDSWLGEVWE